MWLCIYHRQDAEECTRKQQWSGGFVFYVKRVLNAGRKHQFRLLRYLLVPIHYFSSQSHTVTIATISMWSPPNATTKAYTDGCLVPIQLLFWPYLYNILPLSLIGTVWWNRGRAVGENIWSPNGYRLAWYAAHDAFRGSLSIASSTKHLIFSSPFLSSCACCSTLLLLKDVTLEAETCGSVIRYNWQHFKTVVRWVHNRHWARANSHDQLDTGISWNGMLK